MTVCAVESVSLAEGGGRWSGRKPGWRQPGQKTQGTVVRLPFRRERNSFEWERHIFGFVFYKDPFGRLVYGE